MNSYLDSFGKKKSIFDYWSFIEFEHNPVAAKLWFRPQDRQRKSFVFARQYGDHFSRRKLTCQNGHWHGNVQFSWREENDIPLRCRSCLFLTCRTEIIQFFFTHLTGPAEPVRPLRPWSDQKSCHLWSKPSIFRVLVGPIIVAYILDLIF